MKMRFTAPGRALLPCVIAVAALAGTERVAGQPMAYGGENYYVVADSAAADSIRMVEIQSIQVAGSTRAVAKTPVAYTDIGHEQIRRINTGADIPFLLQMTPSVVATSDAGMGVGYTGVRIRGTDASRINVTANGIPINDAESHSVFWVNIPDLAASVEDIQVQRGVGTSTNGAGAFGGSINMRTEALTPKPYAEAAGSYGSYNTQRQSVNVGTGLLGGHWAFNARLSHIASDGYIDRASTKLKSYFFQAGFYSGNTTLKFITFAGKERTYHAWDGMTREEMDLYGRRYNPCGAIPVYRRDAQGRPVYDDEGGLVVDSVRYYKDQTDNYIQTNYQLLFTQRLSDRLALNAGLHYTRGDGYYEEYKTGRSLAEYGLQPFVPQDPSKEIYYNEGSGMVTKSDLVRRKMMDNWFAGGIFSLDYTAPGLSASLGGALNKYDGDHFGNVIWVQNYAGDAAFMPDHRYYDNTGTKTDFNLYLRGEWHAVRGLNLYGDVQYRHINYKIDGTNDNWDWTANDYAGAMQTLNIDNDYDFFNPKLGVSYDINKKWRTYASVAVAHKEPTRNNFTDAEINFGDGTAKAPKSERLVDYEAGASFTCGIVTAGVNLYYMDYKDQLVLTGRVNDIGEALADNVPDSYRMGIELTASAQFTPWLRWDLNATFSRNKIKNYTDYTMDESWENEVATYLGTTDIAYSPEVLVGSLISFSWKGFGASLQSNYVGKQWVTNSASKYTYAAGDPPTENLRLDSYFVNNLRLEYTFKLPSVRSLTVGLAINNIFNEKYCSNGYGWSELRGSEGNYTRANSMYYQPQAGTNVLASLMLRF